MASRTGSLAAPPWSTATAAVQLHRWHMRSPTSLDWCTRARAAAGGSNSLQKAEAWPPDERGHLNGIGLNTTSEPYTFIANGLHEQEMREDGFKEELGFAFDYMSYCAHVGAGDPNDWISPRNWEQLVGNFGVSASAASVKSAAARDAAAAGASRRVANDPLAALAQVHPSEMRVIGFYRDGQVKMTDVGPQVGPPVTRGTPNPAYTLLARGAAGQTVASVPMAATTGGHVMLMAGMMEGGMMAAMGTKGTAMVGPMEGVTFEELNGLVPSTDAKEIQVAVNGKVMATRTKPARAPVVKVLAPRARARVGRRGNVVVRWSSTNPEHLHLTVAIDYSSNAGRTWRTIFAGPNSGRASLPSFFFTPSPGIDACVYGSTTGGKTATRSPSFVALGAPPKVMILTRLKGGMALEGDAKLPLTGRAIDQNGHLLPAKSMRWYDGSISLGTGATIEAGPLPAGANHIRLVARGSSGQTASASLTLTVKQVTLPGLTLSFPKALSRHAHKLRFSGAATIPTTLTVNGHKVQLGTKSSSFSLSVHAGRKPLLLAVGVTTEGVSTPMAFVLSR